MVVVADASPLRYLILIEHTHILQALYGRVLVPPIVITELSQGQTPDIVQRWIANSLDWVRVQGCAKSSALTHLLPETPRCRSGHSSCGSACARQGFARRLAAP